MIQVWKRISLHTLRRVLHGIRNTRLDNRLLYRFQFTEAKKQSGHPLKAILITVGSTVGLLGGGTAYAIIDPNFRQTVEDWVPYSKEVLDYVSIGVGQVEKEPKTIHKAGKDAKTVKDESAKAESAKDHSIEKSALVSGNLGDTKKKVTEVVGSVKDKTVEQAGRIWDAAAETAVALTGKTSKSKDAVKEKTAQNEPATGVDKPVMEAPNEPGVKKYEVISSAKEDTKTTDTPVKVISTTEHAAKKDLEMAAVKEDPEHHTSTEKTPSADILPTKKEPPKPAETLSEAGATESAGAKKIAPTEKMAQVPERTLEEKTIFSIDNITLENRLVDMETTARSSIAVAVESCESAKSAVKRHMDEIVKAVEQDVEGIDEGLWSVVSATASVKKEAVELAEREMSQALTAVEKLKQVVADGRKNKLTQTNQKLLSSEETAAKLLYSLDSMKAMLTGVQRQDKAVEDFVQLVELKRKQFKMDMDNMLPEVKLGETDSKLTEEELNMLLSYASKKVLRLQAQLVKQQTVDRQQYINTLEQQRAEEKEAMNAKTLAELENQQRELEVMYHKKSSELKDELEQELRQQLRRQAKVHSDHLADMLDVQEKELERRWQEALDEKSTEERTKYKSSLASMLGRLRGLEAALSARANLDQAARKAQELWLACQTLKSTIKTGKLEAKSWEDQLKPLQMEIIAVADAAGASNPYVQAVMAAVPKEACTRGVYTEDAMKERFIKVERVCRQVAMVDENGGSLIRYLLSYLQSFLIVNAFQSIPGVELRDEAVDVERFSTFEVLSRARYCIDKDDMQQALRYMNLLRGAPRYVASDWLRETRLLLETRQAADALIAHAAATGTQAL